MGKYWFMVLLFLGVTAIGCQGDHTGEDSRAYAEDEAGSEAVNTLVSGSKYRIVTDVMELRDSGSFCRITGQIQCLRRKNSRNGPAYQKVCTTAFWQSTSVLRQEWICLYW